MYKVGVIGMVLTLSIVLVAVYLLFISDLNMTLTWTMFWHFTLLITGLAFKLSYVLVLSSDRKGL